MRSSFCVLSNSLLSGTTRRWSSSAFSASAPESASSLRSAGSFYGFRDQDLGSGCGCCHWDVTACSPSKQTELGNTCICYPILCVHTSLCVTLPGGLVVRVRRSHRRSLGPFPCPEASLVPQKVTNTPVMQET